MKKLLTLLLTFIGVTTGSCDHRCYYGPPEDIYEEKSVVDEDISSTADNDGTMDSIISDEQSENEIRIP